MRRDARINRRVQLARLPMQGINEPPGGPVLERAPVIAHEEIAPACWLLTLTAPVIAGHAQPGQFAMLTVASQSKVEPVLPRPMAIYAWNREHGTVQIVYRIVGEGTRLLATWRIGERMTVVGPLGRAFSLHPKTRSVLLLGRGIGTCSLTALSGIARERGVEVHAVVSARNREALIGTDAYKRNHARTVLEVIDIDGSSSVSALYSQLEVLMQSHSVEQIFVCGSNRLLQLAAELGDAFGAGVQVSLEAHMACGLGYCHGCSTGYPGLAEEAPLVCKDGPVFAYVGVNA